MSNEIFSTRNTASLQGIFLVYYYIICLSDNIKRLAGHVSHCKALQVHSTIWNTKNNDTEKYWK